MFPASTKAGGMVMAFPDTCKTQVGPATVPIPYPNIGQLAQATKTSKKVKIVNAEAVTVKSEIPSSQGDNPGMLKGMMSSTNMDKIIFKKGSAKVKAEGAEVCHLMCQTGHNGANANAPGGCQVMPSQTKVFVAP